MSLSPSDTPTCPPRSSSNTPPSPAAVSDAALFDVCHVGVVLRATLSAHAVLAIGVLFVASSLDTWLLSFALGAGIVTPALLAWLIAICALKAPLTRLARGPQALVTGLLGAACAWGSWRLAARVGLDEFNHIGPLSPLGAALTGAGLALLMLQWLRLRALARTPADTAARLAELQSRIRPHFLFNTLNSALALVRHDPQRAEAVLEDLAELFRVALTESGDSVTLQDEVDLAQRYLAIEQIRFGERLAVSWDLDPATGGARVPALLLQPLIENAVRHGIEAADGGGTSQVHTRAKGAQAVISVVNSLSATASRPGLGMALHNVQERLRLMHDVNARFEHAREDGQFRVQIVVPL